MELYQYTRCIQKCDESYKVILTMFADLLNFTEVGYGQTLEDATLQAKTKLAPKFFDYITEQTSIYLDTQLDEKQDEDYCDDIDEGEKCYDESFMKQWKKMTDRAKTRYLNSEMDEYWVEKNKNKYRKKSGLSESDDSPNESLSDYSD
jgi:hypothetical protein